MARAIDPDTNGHKRFCLVIIGDIDISEDDDPTRQDPFGHIKEHFPRGLSFRLLASGEMDIILARVADIEFTHHAVAQQINRFQCHATHSQYCLRHKRNALPDALAQG